MANSTPHLRSRFRDVTPTARDRHGDDPPAVATAPGYPGAGKLLGRAALITGGDSGIGRAVATLFASEGADIALVYAEDQQTDALGTARAVEQEGRRAMMIPGDARDAGFCAEAVEGVVHRLGSLDILVNCASAFRPIERVPEMSRERLVTTLETDIFSCFHMIRCALAHMQAGATIINTSSVAGLSAGAGLIEHATTNGAIHAFTKSLAQNLLGEGIRVNCVAAMYAQTLPRSAEHARLNERSAGALRGRPAPEEIAPAYLFFASDADSGYITGQVLPVARGPIAA